jgi:hypothetical protein
MDCPAPFVQQGDECTLTFSSEVLDKHGHVLEEGDNDPKAKNGCDHRDTPEWKAEHAKKAPKKIVEVKKMPQAEVVQPPATIASVSVPVAPVDVPKPPPVGMTGIMLVGMLSGAVTSAAMPALMNFLKSRLKKSKPKQEKKEDPVVDCKTHNMKCTIHQQNVKRELESLSARVSRVEEEEMSPSLSFDDKVDDLVKRIEQLESKKKKA